MENKIANLEQLRIQRAREDLFYLENIPGYKETLTPKYINECEELVRQHGYLIKNSHD